MNRIGLSGRRRGAPLLGAVSLMVAVAAGGTSELAAPFRVEADGQPIDMEIGNAAPFAADFDGDGAFDLLLGQRGDCKMRIYRNLGGNTNPRFGVSAWFRVGREIASLPGG